MKAIIIKDLSITEELDRKAMAAVHGGMFKGMPAAYCLPDYCEPKPYSDPSSFSFNASQVLGQSQSTVNNNGNNVAFSSGITSTVNPSQTGTNTINF